MDSCHLILVRAALRAANPWRRSLDIRLATRRHPDRSPQVRTAFALGLAIALLGAVPAAPAAVEQLTDDDGASGCISVAPVPSSSGSVAAYQSDCDPTGGNADGSFEIFRVTASGTTTQLTSGEGCTSSDPVPSADGSRVAFVSNCNLAGKNADGNDEIFLWTSGGPGTTTQLTQSFGCDNLAPSINGSGFWIAFDSTCNIVGTNNNGRGSEIYRISTAGELQQLTNDPNGGQCDSTSPSISSSGSLVAFDSDCDLVGGNEDLATEIFTVNTSNGNIRQRTTAPQDFCDSVHPSMDAGGSIIAFHGNCDITGDNADGGDEVFTVTVEQFPKVAQVTEADDECASGEPHMAGSGLAITFTSWCPLGGTNGDGSIEVFQAGVGAAAGGIFAVTSETGCSSVAGGIDSAGTRVFLDSDCDLSAGNDDHSVEIFRATACACGAPATRASKPVASDALYALNAAVGSKPCAACECDTDDSGSVLTSDALRILKNAVGQPIALDCPEP